MHHNSRKFPAIPLIDRKKLFAKIVFFFLGNPSAWAHPTLYAAKNFFLDLDSNEDVNVQMYCDIHAHSTLMNGFMYGNIFEDSNRFERQAVFPRLMSNNCDDFSMANTNFNRDQVKAGTGRRYLGEYWTFRIMNELHFWIF